jgi:transcriptional regulator with XRE-family HTH domain
MMEMSQSEVAEALGMNTIQQLSNIERGAASMPLRALKHIPKTYGISKKRLKELLLKDYGEKIDRYL